MKTPIRIAAIVYLVVMIGCIVAFFVQKSLIYKEHIRPGHEQSGSPIAVRFQDKQSEHALEGELTFLNDSVLTNPLRMGNEVQEQLGALMIANLVTGVLLLLVAFTAYRKAEPAAEPDGEDAAG